MKRVLAAVAWLVPCVSLAAGWTATTVCDPAGQACAGVTEDGKLKVDTQVTLDSVTLDATGMATAAGQTDGTQKTQIVSSTGTTLGVAAAPVRVDPTGTTPQPVTINAGTAQIGHVISDPTSVSTPYVAGAQVADANPLPIKVIGTPPVTGSGTAGTPAAGVVTVQGITNGTALTVAPHALTNPSAAATASCLVSGATAIGQCAAAPGAGLYFYLDHIVVSNGSTAQSVQIVQGTGTNCGTGQSVVTIPYDLPASGGAVIPYPAPNPLKSSAANQQLCCKPSGSTAFSCQIVYHTGT